MQRGGLRWEESIAELCRQEGIAQGLYYKWSKDFLEAGKKRLAGDITRQANSSEVKELKSEARELKECVAELTLSVRRHIIWHRLWARLRETLLIYLFDIKHRLNGSANVLRRPIEPAAPNKTRVVAVFMRVRIYKKL